MGMRENTIGKLEKAMILSEAANECGVVIGYGLAEDVLELLKAQDPVDVYGMVLGIDGWGGYCSICNGFLLEHHNKHFCGNCGQAVKWE